MGWERDYVEKLPRFPKTKPQRDVAGRHYLTKADLNALYFATYELKRPRGWKQPFTVGHYWRAALVVFFNYGVDTGTVFKSADFHEPILWRHITWRPEPPNGQGSGLAVRLAVLPSSEDEETVLPSDEPSRSGAPQEHQAG